MNLQSALYFPVHSPSSPATASCPVRSMTAAWSSSSSTQARGAKRSWSQAMSADELLAEPFVNAVASWRAVRDPLPHAYRAEFRPQPSTAFDSLAMLPHEPTRARPGPKCIDRSHLLTLTSMREIERALLQHYPVEELIARRPSSVRDVATLLEPHGYFVGSMDKQSLLRAYEAMCIKNIGPTAGAERIPTAHALETLLGKGGMTGASFTSVEGVQRHLLTLTPPRCATKLVIETLAKPGRLLEGLPLFTPRADLPRVEATPSRGRPQSLATDPSPVGSPFADVSPAEPRSTMPERWPG
jgi:hypothetical protein